MIYIIAIIAVLCVIAFFYSLIKGIGFFAALGKILKAILKMLLSLIAFFIDDAAKTSSIKVNEALKKGGSFKDAEAEERFYKGQECASNISNKAREFKDKL